jgi:hypothetical protein
MDGMPHDRVRKAALKSAARGRRGGRVVGQARTATGLLTVIALVGALVAIGCGAPDSPEQLRTASATPASPSASASAQDASQSPSPAVTESAGASPTASATSDAGPVSQDPIDYSGTYYDPNGGGVTITGGSVGIYDIVVFGDDGTEYRFTGTMTDDGLIATAVESGATMTLKHYEADIGLHVQTSTGYSSDLMP